MRWSEISLKTLRENPADAEMESHRLLVRGGYIKKVAPGIFSYGFLLLRSIRKFETILRDEFAKAQCHEILMPMVQPASLWQESGRWPNMGELLKFKNKNQHDFCLGATHEEVIVDFVRNDLKSYRDLPTTLYQIQTKYRDEIRPRFGLMRGREFIMKDAYSFDRDRDGALASYERMREAYQKIFERLGVEYTVVKADSGAIGGDLSNEFQVVAEHGMDHVLLCKSCGYSANSEVAPIVLDQAESRWDEAAMEKFATPKLKTIEDLSKSLGIPESQLVKTFFVKYQAGDGKWQQATLLLPGNREVNLVKVKTVLGAVSEVEPLADGEVQKLTGAAPGSCGPVGLETAIVLDPSLNELTSFIVGANEDGHHLKNVVPGRDFKPTHTEDISQAMAGDPCPDCGNPLIAKRGIEVGHIFYLGSKYAEPMGLKYLDQNGKTQWVEMGCYGIGVTRTLQAVVEQSHDSDGMVWPTSVAPFKLHICLLDPGDEGIETWLSAYVSSLEKMGVDVFIDDRKERPGIKFKDADLLGFPLRIGVGKRGFDNNEIELFNRKTKEKVKTSVEEALNKTLEILETLS
ncbi:MAG: proline--tRNA ligase [Pseudomonadota bacterium]